MLDVLDVFNEFRGIAAKELFLQRTNFFHIRLGGVDLETTVQSYDVFSILLFHKKRHNFHFLPKSFVYI